MRELVVTAKLGEGSFGSIYKCKTTSRAQVRNRTNVESCTKISLIESLYVEKGSAHSSCCNGGLQNQERTCSVEANPPNPDPSTRRNLVSSQEGRNIKCVVKRVRVDFDKDINDASEALQEAKSLIRLDVHPHVITYMDTWLHR